MNRLTTYIITALTILSASEINAQTTIWSSTALDLPIDARSSGLGFKVVSDIGYDGFAGVTILRKLIQSIQEKYTSPTSIITQGFNTDL